MQVEHLYPQFHGLLRCPGDRVGNIMKLQVQKDMASLFLHRLHGLFAKGGEKLQPHLEQSYPVFQKPHESPDFFQGMDVQGENDPPGLRG